MPTYDLDEESTVFELLKIKVGGKDLTIRDVDRKEYDKITNIDDPYEQLACWAKVPVKELELISFKKLAAALKIIGRDLLGPAVGNFAPKKA